jgi:UDP-N-acetylmuramoyl-tripeptide--D-alanyl-D-alanine ligase
MRKIFKKIVIFILKQESKLVLWRFKPKVIAVTGSVGKTSTKNAIFSALSDSLHIRKNQKSFNSEIGVPLTILGLDNGYRSFFKWLENVFLGLLVPFKKDYPQWLVLETGVDRPNDMEYLINWIKIDIAVFTTFPSVPVHVEYFGSPKEVIEEKKKLLKGVKKDGFVILNADDPEVLSIKSEAKRKVITFGIENEADIRVSNEEFLYDEEQKPKGINFRIDYQNNSVPIKVEGVLGRQHVYPVLAAMACGISQDITTIEMSDSLQNLKPAPGRMRILEGINNTTVIDDSYNASPIAVQEALKSLSKIENKGVKIAVLGDMSEIGRYTANEHKIIGSMVADLEIDYLLTFGKRAEFIYEEALISGMSEEKVFKFSEFGELSKKLKELTKEGSVVLIKGSQVMRTEKIVKQVMKEPEKARELLVRQDDFWLG